MLKPTQPINKQVTIQSALSKIAPAEKIINSFVSSTINFEYHPN
jgi:hypothetical protein